MTLLATMKQALEALEKSNRFVWHYAHSKATARIAEQCDEAITSLRKAIQEEALRNVQRIGQEIEQEPVAWGWAIMHSDGTKASVRSRIVDFFGDIQEKEPFTSEDAKRADQEWSGLAPHTIVTLYTHPPQRTWVGLTDEEAIEIGTQCQWYDGDCERFDSIGFARAIEAKLKEKNT